MSIEKYFLEGFASEELINKLKDSREFALVRELCHKFNLKVLCFNQEPSSQVGWQLCHVNGLAVGKAFTRMNTEDKLEYCYRTPYYKKERGSSMGNRETLHSTKISSLMSTMSRVKAIPSITTMVSEKIKFVSDAKGYVKEAMGKSSKDHSALTANEIHALLCSFLGESPNGNHIAVDTVKCQNVLDKYNEADRVHLKKIEEVKRIFLNPFYMIGVDLFGHFIVCKLQLSGDDAKEYEILEPFKRYKDIAEYEALVPVMTMTKIAYEGKQRLQGGYIPVMDKYDENLDAVFFYQGAATHYDHIYMVTPC